MFQLFTLARVPVSISIWFFVLLAFWGASAGSVGAGLLWIAAVTLSILVHEFGHALVAKRYRLAPRVVLHGWGGLCLHRPAPSAGKDLAITIMGPGAGLLFGALLALCGLALFGSVPSLFPDATEAAAWGQGERVLRVFLLINIVWSLLNLLPLWPLDGGHVLSTILVRTVGVKRAHNITHRTGLILGSACCMIALLQAELFLAIMAGLLVYENAQRLRVPPSAPSWTQDGTSPASYGHTGYTQQPQSRFDLRLTPMVKTLIIILVAIWLLSVALTGTSTSLAQSSLWLMLSLEPLEAIGSARVWQIGTYSWLHDTENLAHILGNCFGLWMLGGILERRWGRRDFLKFFLLTGLGAGIFSIIAGYVYPAKFSHPIIGASGAIMGMVAALSITMPREKLMLFLVTPIEARWIVWIVVLLDSMMFWLSEGSDLAWQTHMGGMITAWLLITGNWRPTYLLDRLRLWLIRRGKRKKKPHLQVLPGGKDDSRYLN